MQGPNKMPVVQVDLRINKVAVLHKKKVQSLALLVQLVHKMYKMELSQTIWQMNYSIRKVLLINVGKEAVH